MRTNYRNLSFVACLQAHGKQIWTGLSKTGFPPGGRIPAGGSAAG
jgi:hypothetical protein